MVDVAQVAEENTQKVMEMDQMGRGLPHAVDLGDLETIEMA